jgi:hypothetical protein
VALFYGRTNGPYRFAQPIGELDARRNDAFGVGLAAGDVTGDGIDELFIGAPNGEAPRGVHDAGYVMMYRGAPGRINLLGTRLHQGSGRIPGTAEPNDHFGAAITVADYTGDTRPDVLISSWGDGVTGHNTAGELTMLPAQHFGTTRDHGKPITLHADDLGAPVRALAGFGYDVAG